jgi:hypothetical protein
MYALGLTGGVAGSFFEHVEAAFVCAHLRIMRTCRQSVKLQVPA